MARVDVVFLQSFVHGSINAEMNRGMVGMEKGLAQELERAGLLRIKMPQQKAPSGKVQDDGPGSPSSASQAAPASQKVTVERFEAGETKRPKSGKS